MGSGNKRVVFNTLERAVSTDHNRLQSLLAADSHEFHRHLVNRDIVGDFYNFPGLQQPFTALPASNQFLIPHDCISGLLVNPANASGLLIDPGEAAFFVAAFPNATADDSKYIHVSSAGVSSLATLPFVANGGGAVRWDIVECQPTESLLESASRDTYNPANGQFTNGTIPKVRGGELTFRIRQGTAGLGVPDIDSAWLPLAAIHTRPDSTGFQDCDIYDIRPLVGERCPWSPSSPQALPTATSPNPGFRLAMYEAELGHRAEAGIAGQALVGYWRSHFGGYWSGGAIRCNVPSVNAAAFGATTVTSPNVPYFNPQAAINRSQGFTIAGDTTFTIGAFFPRGYPRWVRLSQVPITADSGNHLRITGRRIPQGPRGILMICNTGASGNGIIQPKAMPAVFDDPQAAWGHVVGEGMTDGTTEFYPAIGGTTDKKFSYAYLEVTPASGATPTARTVVCTSATLPVGSVTSTAALSSFDFFFPRDYPIPPYAKAIQVDFQLLLTFAGAEFVGPLQAMQSDSAGVGIGRALPWQASPGITISNIWSWQGSLWIPLSPSSTGFDDNALAPTINFVSFLVSNTAAPTGSAAVARLVGYQI